jgi:hypothetical protein
MALKIFSKTKSGLKRVFGTQEITSNYESIKEMAKGFYDYNTHKIGQTGKERSVYIPVNFLRKRERDFRNLFFLFGLILILSVIYFVLSLLKQHWLQALLVFSFCLFIAALTFRYHFWWIQIKKRKLGCTFDEWKDETLKEFAGRDKS